MLTTPNSQMGPKTRRAFSSARAYIETFLWIRDKKGHARPFFLNAVQKRVMAEKLAALRAKKSPRFLILKSRRPGVTTLEQGCSYALCATNPGQSAVTLADTRDKSKRIFRAVNFFYERSPEFGRPKLQDESRQELDFREIGSSFFIGTAGATTFGRGDTLHRVHGSEVAYWLDRRDPSEVDNLIAGLTEACSHGEITLESTANGQRGWFHSAVMDSIAGRGEWTLIFLPWPYDSDCAIPCVEEEGRGIMGSLSDREKWLVSKFNVGPEQLKWRRSKIAERAMRSGRFLQEYPETVEEAFIASTVSYFSPEVLNRIALSIPERPLREENGVSIFKEREDGHRYVFGMDPAEGVPEGDPSSGIMLDAETGEQVASLWGRFSPPEFARRGALLSKHYNYALIGCERENHGHLALHVLANEVHYPRLYREKVVNDKRKASMKLGWSTNPLTRPIMLNDLREAIEEGHFGLRDRGLLSECHSFEDNGDGRYEARPGAHDDRVMASAVAWQVRKRGIHEIRVTTL